MHDIWILLLEEGSKNIPSIDNFKKLIDIIVALTTWIAIVIGAIAAWGIFLMSSKPIISMDHLIYWPQGIVRASASQEEKRFDASGPFVSVQIRLLNPAIGSKVVSEFWLEPLVIELNNQSPGLSPNCFSIKPYLFLKKLVNGDKIEAAIDDLYHPFTMTGHGEKVKHILFIPESSFSLDEGSVVVKLSIKYKIHNPITRPFKTPRDQPLDLQCTINVTREDINTIEPKIFYLI